MVLGNRALAARIYLFDVQEK